MTFNPKTMSLRLALLGAAILAPSAHATLLDPAGTVSCTTCTTFTDLLSNYTYVTGTTLTVNAVNAQNQALYTANVVAAVYSDKATGGLDFFYQVKDAVGPDTIVRISNTVFTGFTTNVGYRTDGIFTGVNNFMAGTVAPTSIDRNSSDTVGFTLTLGPSKTSDILVIKTNATKWTVGTTNLIDGGVNSVNTFAPTSVPEPASMAMIGAGLLALGIFRRKLV